ncbi:MAG TPA: myxococcus cysteine-rich repeat containing protein, partial [Polyangiaceae bacterium]|nr:myxococcus cysteine-rich repeat containing protein [Polyangiaceae bacterium]
MGLRVVCAALTFAALPGAGCDPSSPLGVGGSGGQSGSAGSSGTGGAGAGGQGGSAGSSGSAQLTQLDPFHYRLSDVTLPAGTGGVAGAGGGNSGAGGSSGASAGASGAGGNAAQLTCTPSAPPGTPPAIAVCGDGFRTGAEACDDGNLLSGDACSPTCQVTPLLVAPHSPATNPLPLPGRELGSSRHPLAAGCNLVGAAYLDRATQPPTLNLATFSSVGKALALIPFGTANVDSPSPALAALPDDSFVVAWTDFDGDGDELGIQLRKIDPALTAQAESVFANSNTPFSQRAPDVVFDGRKLVVAWVDDSDPATGPDLRYRTFAPDLTPLSDDQTLAATASVEGQVALAAFNGTWAAAWRSGTAGAETIEAQLGTTHWSIGPIAPGAPDDHPALAFIDATHLAVAFTEGTDPTASGTANTPRLHAAIFDAAAPGLTASFAVAPTVAPYATTPTSS